MGACKSDMLHHFDMNQPLLVCCECIENWWEYSHDIVSRGIPQLKLTLCHKNQDVKISGPICTVSRK